MTTALLLVAALVAPPQDARAFDVPAGPAVAAVNRLAAQAEVDVAVQADLTRLRTPAVRGRMTAAEAFERLLAPVGARAVPLSDRLYRIERAPRRAARVAAVPPRPAPPIQPTDLGEVVVTAPVSRGGLGEANGRSSIDLEALARVRGANAAEALADLSASVDSTRQGPGRNKLFVRGVADSAFNGPLQATVGQYLGDLRLNYGSPDPDLVLVDIQRLEVFEGPQSTRFGSGSIGGVVRFHPTPPQLGVESLDMSAAAAVTEGGGPGGDAAMTVNRGLGQDAALRLSTYGRREGGFLSNPRTGGRHEDATDVLSARAAGRLVRGGWTLDAVGLAQRIASDDAQTVSLAAGGPTKTRAAAEPYRSALALAGLSATRPLASGKVTAAASLSRQVLDERFDATPQGEVDAEVVDRRQSVTALSLEARLEWDGGGFWSFNGGGALALGRTRSDRIRHPAREPEPVSGAALSRRFAESAIFFESIAAPTSSLSLALGGRLSLGYGSHEIRPLGPEGVVADHPSRSAELTLSPTAALRWMPDDRVMVFARFERGVRPGTVAETRGAVETLRGDRVSLVEAGARAASPSDAWTLQASAGWLDWRDIQADLITQGGDLVTANAGDGEVLFLQVRAAWRPTAALSLSGGLFLNESTITLDGPNTIGVAEGPIPNVAGEGAQLSFGYDAGRLLGLPLGLAADFRYVGRSRPGLGPGLDVLQGGYWRSELSARWGGERAAIVARLSNPQNDWAIRYGVGSPYQLSDPQGAPLRPLTLRLGFEASF